ncbi:MAG: response regulator [Magnetospirillum sp.]|nr:response regulator [Magnetospirillum sp.]
MAIVLPGTAAAIADFDRCHVLVVDPFITNRRLMRDMLRSLGVGASDSCGRAADAMALLDAGGFNLIFLDWSDQIDAVAFLHALRADDNPHRFVPAIVVSANGGIEDVARARDAGATEYMLKPYSTEVVASRLRSVVLQPRLFIRSGSFFGPDRRRRRLQVDLPERRHHDNVHGADRRHEFKNWPRERRQGRPGFATPERRSAPR